QLHQDLQGDERRPERRDRRQQERGPDAPRRREFPEEVRGLATRMTRAAVTAFFASAAGLLIAGAGVGAAGPAPDATVSGTIVFDGVWPAKTGQPQFQAVIDQFERRYPNVHVTYRPIGPGIPIALEAAVAAGHPPDMADLPQPGAVQELVDAG